MKRPSPLVMCLTNAVAANFTANCLLAIGATPAMIEEPTEAAELAAASNAVLVNVGTVTPDQAQVMRSAIGVCREKGIPWVLDPVAADLLGFRRQLVFEFARRNPSLVRGNLREIAWLRKELPDLDVPMLATGERDEISSDSRTVTETVSGGSAMLQRVTATGCAQGAVCAAFLGWGYDPIGAARRGSEIMKRAGEIAFAKAGENPGSFQIAVLDALSELIASHLC